LVDVVRRQALDPEQMAVREPGLGSAPMHKLGTIGRAALRCNNDCSFDEA
jgi:hypothetical protein